MQAPPYSTLHATNLRKMVPRYLLLVGVVLLVGQGFLPPVIAHSESYTLVDFISDNEIYSFLPDTLTVLEDPDAEVTLFVPVLTNITALQAAEFPQLLPNLVLPKVYPTAADLLAAAPLTNLFNSTVTLTDDPKLGVFHAVFVEAGNATADIFPVAFRIGKSVAYLITPLTAGKLPKELGDV